MRRRNFYALSGATVAWPVVVRAQSTTGHPLVGVLSPQSTVAATRARVRFWAPKGHRGMSAVRSLSGAKQT
jgi:hypothetical protein